MLDIGSVICSWSNDPVGLLWHTLCSLELKCPLKVVVLVLPFWWEAMALEQPVQRASQSPGAFVQPASALVGSAQ